MTRIEPERTASPWAQCGCETQCWPPSPIPGSERLVPIDSWAELWEEARVTGVELDAFWLDNVESGAAYFFRWLGAPRATVLAIWCDSGIRHVECRGKGDRQMRAAESMEIVEEVHRLFLEAGFKALVEGAA